jgi:hypothetical protein
MCYIGYNAKFEVMFASVSSDTPLIQSFVVMEFEKKNINNFTAGGH